MVDIFENFNLYHRMLEECNNKKDTIDVLTDSINQLKFTLEEVEYFINNYTNIKYTSNNINCI